MTSVAHQVSICFVFMGVHVRKSVGEIKAFVYRV